MGIQGSTDIDRLGIQSGFLRRYSPGSFSSPTPERAKVTVMAVVQVQYSTVCALVRVTMMFFPRDWMRSG